MVPRQWLAVLAASLPLLAGACTDRSSTPTGPRESLAGAPVDPLACSFTNAKNLAQSEFTNSTTRTTARNLVDAMSSAGQYKPGAVSNGFSIMALIASAKKLNQAKDAATGSDLTNALILCMFDPKSGADNFPSPFPVDFTPSLDRSQPGAYEVRGPTADANAVLSFPTTAYPRISGVTPIGNWQDVLGETTLIYGLPIALPAPATGFDQDQYEWKTIRPGVTFHNGDAPGVNIALCNSSTVDPNDMLNESNVGFLPFDGNPPACIATFSQARSWGPRQLVDALQRFGTRLLRPEPAYASAVMFSTTISGSAKGGKSIYKKKKLDPSVASVLFTFVQQPTQTSVGVPMNPAPQVQATYQGDPVQTVVLTLAGVTNNGTPTDVLCGTPQVSPCKATTTDGGIATFNNLIVTKSGAIQLVVTQASIVGRNSINFATGKLSVKVNIKPK